MASPFLWISLSFSPTRNSRDLFCSDSFRFSIFMRSNSLLVTDDMAPSSSFSFVTSSMNSRLLMVIWVVSISLSAHECSSSPSRVATVLCRLATVLARRLLSLITSDIFSEVSLSRPSISDSKLFIFLLWSFSWLSSSFSNTAFSRSSMRSLFTQECSRMARSTPLTSFLSRYISITSMIFS